MPYKGSCTTGVVHVDFTSVESIVELNKPPSIKNVLIITDHFTCYALAVMTKDQTAKTVAKVLYERFIMVFGMPCKTPKPLGSKVHLSVGRGFVHHIWHPEMPDYCITSAM